MLEEAVAGLSIHHASMLLYTCSQPSTTCLSCMASSAWTSFPVWRPFSFGPALVSLPGSPSPSSQCWALTAQHWQKQSGVVEQHWVYVESCHWRAVEHQRIHLYQSGPRSPRGCPRVKHYLEGCWERRDRLGKMWTGQANIGLQWLYGLCAVCALTASHGDRLTGTSIWRGG